MRSHVQMSLCDIYTDLSLSFAEDKPSFFRLLDEHIHWDALIPLSFHCAFYRHTGRKRVYPLQGFIRALVLQRVFGYTDDAQLLNTLRHSSEMRAFCGFSKVPDAAKLTRFKQNFCAELAALLDRLVDLTEPICCEMNPDLAAVLLFDTTGIESYVAENNPKFLNSKLRQAKQLAKSNSGFDPYKGVYALLPEAAAANPAVRQQYSNGHFCYAQKAAVVTNGLGIVRHIDLLDDDFKRRHPNLSVPKRSDNPDLDKEIGDSMALNPVLSDFFAAHPSAPFTTFIGDAAFDSYDNYALLLRDFRFERALIPINPRNSQSTNADFNEHGVPLCPRDGTPFTYLAKSGGKNRSARLKWVCHKSRKCGTGRICDCENPCTPSAYGRCVYTYPDKNLRLYPGIGRDSEEWTSLYKRRVAVERSIGSFKAYFCLAGRKTANSLTTKADLILAAIVQLLGVLIADALHQPQFARSIRRLIA